MPLKPGVAMAQKCRYCDESSLCRISLLRHEVKAHPQNFSCRGCKCSLEDIIEQHVFDRHKAFVLCEGGCHTRRTPPTSATKDGPEIRLKKFSSFTGENIIANGTEPGLEFPRQIQESKPETSSGSSSSLPNNVTIKVEPADPEDAIDFEDHVHSNAEAEDIKPDLLDEFNVDTTNYGLDHLPKTEFSSDFDGARQSPLNSAIVKRLVYSNSLNVGSITSTNSSWGSDESQASGSSKYYEVNLVDEAVQNLHTGFLKAAAGQMEIMKALDSTVSKIEELSQISREVENVTETEDLVEFQDSMNGEAIEAPHPDVQKAADFLARATNKLMVKKEVPVARGAQTCEVCGETCRDMTSLQRHMNKSHGDKSRFTFRCATCLKDFSRRSSFLYHIVEDLGKWHQCDKCDEKFPARDALLKHLGTGHRKARRRRKLLGVWKKKSKGVAVRKEIGRGKEEEKAFKKQKQVKEEESGGEGVEESVACQLCYVDFPSIVARDIHVKNFHGENSHVCMECGSSHTRVQELLVHMRNHSRFADVLSSKLGPIKPGDRSCFDCEYCLVRFQTEALREKHSRKYHVFEDDTGWRHECAACGEVFSDSPSLKHHMKIHVAKDRHVCKLCSKGFKTKIALGTHERAHHADLVCSVCDAVSLTKEALDEHMQSHEDTAPSHECDICFKVFMDTESYQAHLEEVNFHVDSKDRESSSLDVGGGRERRKRRYGDYLNLQDLVL